MKKIFLSACSAALLLIACNGGGETTENKKDTSGTTTATTEVKKDEPWVPVDSATMMKAMMDYGTPGEMHKMLDAARGRRFQYIDRAEHIHLQSA